MPRLHSTLIALVLGGAAVAGLFALVHTVRLGQNASAAPRVTVSAHELAARRAKLAKWSHALQVARDKRPPALPKLPTFAPIPASPPPAAPTTAPSSAASVTYTRPPTVVEYRHAAQTTATTQYQGDDGGEQADQGDGGGEGD